MRVVVEGEKRAIRLLVPEQGSQKAVLPGFSGVPCGSLHFSRGHALARLACEWYTVNCMDMKGIT